MGLRSWWFGDEQHARGGPQGVNGISRLISAWQADRPIAISDDYRALIQQFYKRNHIIFACMEELAASAAEPIPMAYLEDEPQPQHELTRLLQQPNPDQDAYALFREIRTHWDAAGCYYIHKVRSGAGRIVEMYALRPDRVQPILHQDGSAAGFDYVVDGTRGERLPPEDVIWQRFVDPVDDIRGLSKLQVAGRIADLDNQAIDFLRAVFMNGGMPRGLLKFKNQITPDIARRTQKNWQDQYSGSKGWGRVAVLDGDADYTKLGFDLKEADTGGVLSVTECRICSVFQVPPILVSAKIGLERATYANYKEARRALWQDCLSPYYASVAGALTRGLRRDFAPASRKPLNLSVRWDTSRVAALQEEQDKLWERALKGWESGLTTRNESRAIIRLPRDINGDVYNSSLETMGEPALLESQSRDNTPAIREAAERLHRELSELQPKPRLEAVA